MVSQHTPGECIARWLVAGILHHRPYTTTYTRTHTYTHTHIPHIIVKTIKQDIKLVNFIALLCPTLGGLKG